MALVVNTNVSALVAHRRLTYNSEQVAKSLERLASGYRINRAADDAAGLTISENLVSEIRGNQKALQNTQDGISILQIAEGAISVILENLQRMRELTVQAANDTNSQAQRDSIGRELRSRADDIDRIAQATQFNGINLLDGSASNALLQIGAGSTLATNTLDVTQALTNAGNDMDAANPGIGIIGSSGSTNAGFTALDDLYDLTNSTTSLTSGTIARNFLDDIDAAISNITTRLSTIGSFQNQLESVTSNLQFAIENFSSSNSRIRDLDMASESANLVQFQILQQSSVSVLSQANKNQQLALSLLQQQ